MLLPDIAVKIVGGNPEHDLGAVSDDLAPEDSDGRRRGKDGTLQGAGPCDVSRVDRATHGCSSVAGRRL